MCIRDRYLFYPFFKNIINSFQIIKDLGAPAKGWNDPIYKNYAKLFTDKNMAIAMKNTLIMIVVTLLGQVGIALILSLMVDNIKRGAKFFRIVYFFPIVVSATAPVSYTHLHSSQAELITCTMLLLSLLPGHLPSASLTL